MKRLLLLLVCVLIVLLQFGGCQGSGVNKRGGEAVIADGRFPQSLAGTWQADASPWQVTLTPDGNVVSVVDAAGLSLVMAEGGLFQPGPTESSFLYLIFGPSYADYNPATRQLSVTINIEDFRMQVDDATLEGGLKYYFTGPVSKNGKRWNVKLLTYARLEGSESFDPNLADQELWVFNKVQNNQLNPMSNQ